MSRRAQENVLAGVLLALLTGVLVISFTYGPRTRLVPVPVAAFGILLLIGQIVVQNTGSADDLHVDVLEVLTRRRPQVPAAPASPDEPEPSPGRQVVPGQGVPGGRSPGAAEDVTARGRREFLALGMVVLLVALMLLLGAISGIFLFVLGYAAGVGRMRWYTCLGLAFGVSACLYLLFVLLLGTQLYRGVLPGLL